MERWESVKGYVGLYEVSTLGRVRVLDRLVKNGITKSGENYFKNVKGRVLKQHCNSWGYPMVTLTKEGKRKGYSVHRLVALSFIQNKYNKNQINHIDENKLNNSVNNLEWVTCKENINHGTHKKRMVASSKGLVRNSVLTRDQANEIRKLYSTGKYYQKEIGSMYGVKQQAISSIITNKRWSHDE